MEVEIQQEETTTNRTSSSRETEIQAPSILGSNANVVEYNPGDPLQQKNLLEALNANNEMIRKVIMRQSHETLIQNKSGSGDFGNTVHKLPRPGEEHITPNSPQSQIQRDPQPINVTPAAAAGQENGTNQGSSSQDNPWKSTFTNPSYTVDLKGDTNSPQVQLHKPPGMPSSSNRSPSRSGSPGTADLNNGENNNNNDQISNDLHSMTSVLHQISSPVKDFHTTASIRQQLATPSPSQQEGNPEGGTRRQGTTETPPRSDQKTPKTYAQATVPSLRTTEDPPVWSLHKSKEYVREAMTQMPQRTMIIELDGIEVEFTLDYEDLPKGCFVCHQTGHIARTCPQLTTTKEVDPKEFEVAFKEAVAHKEKKTKEREERQRKREEIEPTQTMNDVERNPRKPGRIILVNQTSFHGINGASTSRGAGSNRFLPLAKDPDEELEERRSVDDKDNEDEHNSVRLGSSSEKDKKEAQKE
ncbi:hypothetical protein R1sor_006659 [Riccia sorocarpa]|uniref:CCHC-type domain-containing protein n=1 Tax=Riccia sorocarpa TaxID=122646 RepID=A0ABD3HNJ8_9MARC